MVSLEAQCLIDAASAGWLFELGMMIDKHKYGGGIEGVQSLRDPSGLTLLHHAAANGRTNLSRFLMNEYGLDVFAKDNLGNTPLHLAIKHKQCSTSYCLLDHGAQLYVENNSGRTPLSYAAERGQKDQLLLHLQKTKNKNPQVFLKVSVGGDPGERIVIEVFSDVAHQVAEDFWGLCTDRNFELKHTEPGYLSMAICHPSFNSQLFITFSRTPDLDRRHILLGKVVQGMDIVKKMEEVGTSEGKPTKQVKLVDCGAVRPESEKISSVCVEKYHVLKKAAHDDLPSPRKLGQGEEEAYLVHAVVMPIPMLLKARNNTGSPSPYSASS